MISIFKQFFIILYEYIFINYEEVNNMKYIVSISYYFKIEFNSNLFFLLF